MLNEAILAAKRLYETGNRAQATTILQELACQFPDEPMPFYLFAMWLLEDGQDHLAMPILHHVHTMMPKNPEVLNNLALLYKRHEHQDQAVKLYEKALDIDKNFGPALKGLSGCYVNQGFPEPGIYYAQRALECEGEHYAHARNDLALLLLEKGDWENGFKEYRHRSDLPNYHVRDYGDVPRWNGQKVNTLAIHAEQGLGDEILFASCIADVSKFAKTIVGECNERLLPLFNRSFPTITWYPTHEDLIANEKPDAWERMGDLPYWFRKKPQDCPGRPYLKADPAKVAGYRARLKAIGDGPYIGFAWLGGTAGTHRKDRRAPRQLWTDLVSSIQGTKVSLQYGEDGARHAKEWGLHHWQMAIDDLEECAALIMALDVVVSSPQTVIHMAGALGKQCLVTMSSKPAWRYQIEGQMPWYKSVELIRQSGDDWPPVFKEIHARLNLGKLQAA